MQRDASHWILFDCIRFDRQGTFKAIVYTMEQGARQQQQVTPPKWFQGQECHPASPGLHLGLAWGGNHLALLNRRAEADAAGRGDLHSGDRRRGSRLGPLRHPADEARLVDGVGVADVMMGIGGAQMLGAQSAAS